MLINEKISTTATDTARKQTHHLWVLMISLVLATLATQLLSGERLGLNFIVFNTLCIAAMLFLRKKFHYGRSKNERLLLSSAMIMSLFLIFRQSEVLHSLNILAIITIICLSFAQRYTGSLFNLPIIAWLFTPIYLLHLCWLSTIRLMAFGFKSPFTLSHQQKHLRSVILGLIWASPILLLLGSLLVSSDNRFEQFTQHFFSFDFFELFDDILQIIGYFPLVGAFLYATTLMKLWDSTSPVKPSKELILSMEGIQILTILNSINLLFISYIMVQFSYFFGGEQLVLTSTNLTYANYARSGFWELVTLAMLVLPILLSTHWLQRRESNVLQRWFKYSALFMVACLIMIEASALYRMMLYINIYQLTELRFYSSLFMLYMILGLITFCLTVLNNKREYFIISMVSQALIMVVALNIMNPDAQISQYNMTHNQNKTIDRVYFEYLSSDAYPSIYKNKALFEPKHFCLLQQNLVLQQKNKATTKWHQWNWSAKEGEKIMALWQKECQSKQ